jgi:molybdate transport system substrate-binding protein
MGQRSYFLMKSSIKKTLALLLALAMTCALVACGSTTTTEKTDETETTQETETTTENTQESQDAQTESETAEPAEDVELVVFAAASMTETLNQIKEIYEASHENVTLTFNFDSSGTLKTQIEEGADCDIFISAGQKQMNQLDITASSEVNTDGLDFVNTDTRINLLENKVTLVVPEGNPKGIESFDALAEAFKNGDVFMAMGNNDVPVGQYTQKILAYYELDETELANAGLITYGSNVKEVTTQVSEGSVDCGVIYCTDAYSAGLTIVDYATAEMCGQVIYPAAVMKNSANTEAAQEFLNFLTGDEAMEIFGSVGFSPAA